MSCNLNIEEYKSDEDSDETALEPARSKMLRVINESFSPLVNKALGGSDN